jgi:lipoate-protein ligase A
MATDEDLLALAQAGDRVPVLRFYTWHPPAVSIGRFQRIEEAVDAEACRRLGIDIVRRVTGGRAVLHDRELTYSIISRTDTALFPPDVLGTYKVIAAGLLTGFRNLGIPAEMVSHGSRTGSLVNKHDRDPSCFSSPSWYEIIVKGRKIVGSAQRRLSSAFLQHGSILISYDSALATKVIPCSGTASAITSIDQELGRDVPLDEIKEAFRYGVCDALNIAFQEQ